MDTNEEDNNDYEEINEKNAIFYKDEGLSPKRNKLEEVSMKGPFYEKVDNITGMILDNLKSSKLSKKQLLQVIISNILKNE